MPLVQKALDNKNIDWGTLINILIITEGLLHISIHCKGLSRPWLTSTPKFYTMNQVRSWHTVNLSLSHLKPHPIDWYPPLAHSWNQGLKTSLFISLFLLQGCCHHFPSISPLNTQFSLIITQIFTKCI